MNKNAAIACIILFLTVCLMASCETGNGTEVGGAERQLDRTLSVIRGKKLEYESRSVVKMDGTTMHNISGNGTGNRSGNLILDPVESLNLLDHVQKTVEFEAKQGDESLRFLLVEVDPADWKQMIEKQIRGELDRKKAEENALVSSNLSRLPPGQAALMEKELQQSINLAEDRLKRVFATLTAKGTYRIIIDRSTSLPKKITVENAMQYEDGGKTQEETVVTTYELQEAAS